MLITPVQGELIYTTDTKKLYVGDGVTVGGIAVDTDTIPSITQLNNVAISSPVSGQVLKFDGANWINGPDLSSAINTIAGLDDASINQPTVDQFLKFNGAKWANHTLTLNNIFNVNVSSTPSNGQVLTFNGSDWVNQLLSLTDITSVANPSVGQALKFDGSNWVNQSVSLSEISGITVTSPTTGQVLKFNGTSWTNMADDVATSIGSISNIGDVTLTGSPAAGEVLKFNGTKWTNNNFVEEIQDVVASMFSGAQTNISVSYDDAAGKLTLVVTDLTGITSVQQDPGPTLGGNLTLNGNNISGTGDISITGSISNNSLTLSNNEIQTVTGPVIMPSGVVVAPTDAPPLDPVSGQLSVADGITWTPAGAGKEALMVYLGGGWRIVAQQP
jgi:hypothetical protein